jgi:4-amino-4-deoxy-L-arabinose transferase-like glycosyltransferase
MNTQPTRFHRFYYFAALALLPAALLIQLGLMTFIDDEAIRSLVALEMKLSGNYVTPTLHGEYYYNKPPLYNWILLAFFSMAGTFNEFTARIPTLLSLCGYAATVFFVFKPKYGTRIAFLNAFVLLTCGRILFWDSILGLIDICFSWVMFGLFMVVYHTFRKGNFLQLFLLSYLLTAVGFLMKGLPALVFQAFTLSAYFLYKGQFRRLFSAGHFLGVGLLAAIVGSYYLVYHQYNDLGNVFATLFDESLKRTGVRFGVWRTVLQIASFPLEMLYHFLPWSLMILYFFRRGIRRQILQDDFITFNLIVFGANIIVYWTSPEVYPRYLLMLAPLLFSAFLYLHDDHAERRSFAWRIIDGVFFAFLLLIVAGSVAPVFLERTQQVAGLYFKTGFLALSSIGLTDIVLAAKGAALIGDDRGAAVGARGVQLVCATRPQCRGLGQSLPGVYHRSGVEIPRPAHVYIWRDGSANNQRLLPHQCPAADCDPRPASARFFRHLHHTPRHVPRSPLRKSGRDKIPARAGRTRSGHIVNLI